MRIIFLGSPHQSLEKHLISKGHELVNEGKADVYFASASLIKFTEGVQEISELKKELKKFDHVTSAPFFILGHTLPKTIDHLRKFYKMNLCALRFGYRYKIALAGLHTNDDYTPSFVKTLFDPEFKIQYGSIRDVEALSYLDDCYQAVVLTYASEVAKYLMRISASYKSIQTLSHFGPMLPDLPNKDGKYGFGDANLNRSVLGMISEWKRLGLQTGMLEACFNENLLHRVCFEYDFPPIEIVVPEKTKEKLLALNQSSPIVG